MPIDNCEHTFDSLASAVLPRHFERLLAAMKRPVPASSLIGAKSASKATLKILGQDADFSGCYVFLEDTKPIYVGISRRVVRRLIQHLNTDTHFSASLVYRMASKDYPHTMRRDQAMKDDQFQQAFFQVQKRLTAMNIAFISIENDLELYLFEVYSAMALDTGTWNTFRTH